MISGKDSLDVSPQLFHADSQTSFAYPFGGARVTILDTDYLMNRVSDQVRSGILSRVHAASRIGGDRVFASSHVLDELYRPDAYGHRHKWDKLAEQSRDKGWATPAEAFRNLFESEYLNRITFVDVTGMFENDSLAEKVRTRDANDAPTAQLAVLLARVSPIVLAHDHSLWKSHVAPHPGELELVVSSGQRVDEANSSMRGVSYTGAIFVMGADTAAQYVATLLRVPRWVPRLAAVMGVGWFFTSTERRAKLAKVLAPFGEHLMEQWTNAIMALPALASAVVRVESVEAVEQRVAEVLALYGSTEGLLAREIQEKLRPHDTSMAVPSIPEIRKIIACSPCFVEVRRWRYQLGSKYC